MVACLDACVVAALEWSCSVGKPVVDVSLY
jgi:hypothetical protein